MLRVVKRFRYDVLFFSSYSSLVSKEWVELCKTRMKSSQKESSLKLLKLRTINQANLFLGKYVVPIYIGVIL